MAQSCVTFPTSTQIFQVETQSYTTQIQSTDCVQGATGQITCMEAISLLIGSPVTYESKNILYQTSCSKSTQRNLITTIPTITSFTPISPSQTASKSETSNATNVGPIEPTLTLTIIKSGTNTVITGPTGHNTTSNPRTVIIEAAVSTSLGLIMLALFGYFLLRRRARRNGTRPVPYTYESVQPAQRTKPPLLNGTSATGANFAPNARATIKEQISSSMTSLTSRELNIAPPPYIA